MLTEEKILSYLTQNHDYANFVFPYLKDEYFSVDHRIIYSIMYQHFVKFGKLISFDEITSEIESQSLKQQTLDQCIDITKKLFFEEKSVSHIDWWIEKTEEFCKEKAIYNAILESINILEKNSKQTKEIIPQLLSDAISVSFDSSIGHHFFNDIRHRFEYYHSHEVKIPFNLSIFNKITQNGFPRKTLNVFAAATGVGKSLLLCHLAAHYYVQNFNVLYITMEMSEEQIAKRIDMNLMDRTEHEIKQMSFDEYQQHINTINSETTGHLIIKEYPTAGANIEHFRRVIKDLREKQGIVPDILIVDYLTICSSARYKGGAGNVNSYFIGKAIAEELRGLCVEFNMVGLSAVQFNRGGYNNSDSDLGNISESAAIAMTVDCMLGMISTDEIRSLNQIMIKQLKNRYGDLNYYNKFLIGVDYAKMRVFELDETEEVSSVKKEPSTFNQLKNSAKNINNLAKNDKFKSFDLEN